MQLTPTTQRRLTSEVSRLRAAGGFQVLAHTAWTQAPAAWNSRRGVSTEQLGIEGAGVSGTVFIERGQYLHLGFDLRVDQGGRVYAVSDLRTGQTGRGPVLRSPGDRNPRAHFRRRADQTPRRDCRPCPHAGRQSPLDQSLGRFLFARRRHRGQSGRDRHEFLDR